MADRHENGESTLAWATRLGKTGGKESTVVSSDAASSLPTREKEHERGEPLALVANVATPGEILVLEDQPFVDQDHESNDSQQQTKSHDKLISLRPKETTSKPATARKYTPFEDEEELLPSPSTATSRRIDTEAIPAAEATLTFRDPSGSREGKRALRRTLTVFTEAPQRGEASSTRSATITLTDDTMVADDLDEDLQLTLKRPRIHHNRMTLLSARTSQRRGDSETTDAVSSATASAEQMEAPTTPLGTLFISDATELTTVLGRGTSMMSTGQLGDPIVSSEIGGSSISLNRQVPPLPSRGSDTLLPIEGDHARSVPIATDSASSSNMLLSVPDKDIPSMEREPLVRRGMAATLEVLARLGIRPQLCSEALPPQQRPPPKRFDHLRLEHRDEEGSLLTAKEAYKLLSHRFHGKGPGKGKQERLARKRVEEQRRVAAPLTDTPLGIGASLRERQRATGSTHIVLAEGAHAAPIDSNPMTPAEVSGDHAKGHVKWTKRQSVRQQQASPIVKKLPKVFGMR